MDTSDKIFMVIATAVALGLGALLLSALGKGCTQPNTRISIIASSDIPECTQPANISFDTSSQHEEGSTVQNFHSLKFAEGTHLSMSRPLVISTFDYEGHTYLTRNGGGIVHSESCKCKTQNQSSKENE